MTCYLDRAEPHVVSIPVEPHHYIYTQKALMSVEGTVRLGDEEYQFDRSRDFVLMDEHKGFSPTEFTDCWGTFASNGEDGLFCGLNISEGIGMGESFWNENCLWTGRGKLLLGTVHFDLDPEDLWQPWQIQDDQGRISLTFVPEARYDNNNNFIVVDMKYAQMFGRYDGFVVDGKGVRHAWRTFTAPQNGA